MKRAHLFISLFCIGVCLAFLSFSSGCGEKASNDREAISDSGEKVKPKENLSEKPLLHDREAEMEKPDSKERFIDKEPVDKEPVDKRSPMDKKVLAEEKAQPEPMQPESTQPEATKPESTKPESTKPESTKPESTKPESTKPESMKPDLQCSSNSDCLNTGASCSESQGKCHHIRAYCVNGTCKKASRSVNLSSYKCDKASGLCLQKCSVHLDCVGNRCRNVGSNCLQTKELCKNGYCEATSTTKTIPNAYCTGQVCQVVTTCKKDLDCGAKSCSQIGGTCFSAYYSCLRGLCSRGTNTVVGRYCDNSTGNCRPKRGCAADSDCGAKGCYQQKRICFESTPTCLSGRCYAKNNSFGIAGCDKATGSCKKGSCSSDLDCGKPTCVDQRFGCQGFLPYCSSGKCLLKRSMQRGKKCSLSVGKCL